MGWTSEFRLLSMLEDWLIDSTQISKCWKGSKCQNGVCLGKCYFYTETEKEPLLKPKITFLPLKNQICLEIFTFRSQSLNIDRIKFWLILGLFRNREGIGWNKKSGEFESLPAEKKGWGQYYSVSLWSISRQRSHHHVNCCNSPFFMWTSVISPFSPLFSVTSLVTPRFIKMLQCCLYN